MSWNQWNTGIDPTPRAQLGGSSIVTPNVASQISFNPAVMPPGSNYASQFSGMTPEQQFAMQQNWQQWQSYQQQYAQWHAQYGEQYKREMEVKLGSAPPSLPFPPSIPNVANIPPYPVAPPAPDLLYTAPPPPPENDLRKPPPPPDNKVEIDRSNSQNYNRNMYMQNRRGGFESNEIETSILEHNNTRMQIPQQNYADGTMHKNVDTMQILNQSVDNSANPNNKTSPATENKSREEKIFDEQFKKWEEEFENWKKANVNHPDKKAYREYEMKFEDCRRKLIERREQMKRKKLQQEEQARHEQQIREQQMREEPIQDHIIRQGEETNQKQKSMHEIKILDEQTMVPSELLTNIALNDIKKLSEVDNSILYNKKPETTPTSDIIEVKSDFLERGKRDLEIPGLDLVQTDLPKEQDDNSNIIDLDKSDDYNGIEGNICSKKNRAEKSRWSNNEQSKEVFKKDWNCESDTGSNSNKIPSLFDQKIEKPTFSPPRENSESIGFPKNDNEKMEDNIKQMPASFQGGSNNMQHLANALADPKVMALLNAALQKTDQISTENKDISEQERNLNKFDDRSDNYNLEHNNLFLRNDFGNRFGRGNGNQVNQFSRNSFGNQFDGGNRFGGNTDSLNIPIWEQDNRNNNWRNQNTSEFNMDKNPMQNNWSNQQGFRQDSQSNRNPFNVLKRGSRDDSSDFDDTGNRKIFDNNNRGRDWGNKRNNRNQKKPNQNNRNLNPASNKDNNFEPNLKSDNINPFKTDLPMLSKSPNFKQQKEEEEDNYFRPAHVIDYQNKSLSNVVNKTTVQKEADTMPTKIVDYGHKTPAAKNISSNIDTENFFPMKTIDYGHASNKTDLEQAKSKQSFGDFLANRTNKRKADDDKGEFEKKKNITFVEKTNLDYSDKWTFESTENKKMKQMNMEDINDCKVNEKYLSNYSSKENLDTVLNVENFFNSGNDNTYKEDLDPPKPVAHLRQRNLSHQTSNIINIKADDPIYSTNIVKKSENIIPYKISIPTFQNNNTIPIEEIILNPGRVSRPKNIVLILRGPPGSGKSYISKLIKDKEIELHGCAPRLLSIDDYFMVEIDKEEKCPNTGRKTIRKELEYEYDDVMEPKYFEYLMKSFKKTLLDQHFHFIIVDCVNHSLRTFTEFYNLAKLSNYTPYTIDLYCNLDKCLKQNIHNRTEADIKSILNKWNNTPDHYIKLDTNNIATSFKQSEANQPIEEKDNSICPVQSDSDSRDSYDSFVKTDFMKCKWDMDTSEASLARLDGTRKNFQTRKTLEDYLQIDGWEPPLSNSNKKRVRWADIEEKRAQDKMRAIGFVVGHTDWNRMLDPTGGSSALTTTKFIEKMSRKK